LGSLGADHYVDVKRYYIEGLARTCAPALHRRERWTSRSSARCARCRQSRSPGRATSSHACGFTTAAIAGANEKESRRFALPAVRSWLAKSIGTKPPESANAS